MVSTVEDILRQIGKVTHVKLTMVTGIQNLKPALR